MIKEKLLHIQINLKAPKNQFNKFGGYKYRNAEDILESVKPLLLDTKTTLTISDEIVNIGNRYYVKATVTLFDTESEDSIHTEAFAREEESKKGMDGSQITGASSSYARKYALNGLFDIDDTKDSDTTNQHDKPEPEETIRDLKKEFDSCKILADAEKLWNTMNESEKKAYRNLKETTKLRIRTTDIEKEVSKLTAKNYQKNYMNIYRVIDSLKGEEKKNLIKIYNDKLIEIGIDEPYQELPFNQE